MKRLLYFLIVNLVMLAASKSNAQRITNLVFEGAGIRGIAYCGALQTLDSLQMLTDITHVAGTSSGAITACLLSVGYSPKEIQSQIGKLDFSDFNDGGWFFIGGLHRLNRKLGWFKGKKLKQWLEERIEEKTANGTLTFQQLDSLAQIDPRRYKTLVVMATCLSHQETMEFSARTFPNMEIADAVRASLAIPLYYEPLIVDSKGKPVNKKTMTTDDHLCVDGGFTANFPIAVFDRPEFKSTPTQTLGLRIDSDQQIENDGQNHNLISFDIQSLPDFSHALYYIIKETMNRYTLTEEDWKRTISISDCSIRPKVKKMSDAEVNQLMQAGSRGVRQYLATHPIR
jgi:NTE family protein